MQYRVLNFFKFYVQSEINAIILQLIPTETAKLAVVSGWHAL